jgi:hypothetical protein
VGSSPASAPAGSSPASAPAGSPPAPSPVAAGNPALTDPPPPATSPAGAAATAPTALTAPAAGVSAASATVATAGEGDAAGGPDEGEEVLPDGVPAAPTEAPRLGRREERSPRDMIMSLAVLLVPIALLLIFYRVVLSGDAPITVDPAPTLQEARQAAVFTVAEPTGLSDDWHVSSATFKRQPTGATLRLGYVDPDKDPVQLVESNVPTATLLPAELGSDAKALGNVRTTAGVWKVYDGRPGEKALVLADTARTIVIVGKTDLENLQTLASSLK